MATERDHPAWHCLAVGCTTAIPPEIPFCGHHWSLLTPDLQTQITRLHKVEYTAAPLRTPRAYLDVLGRAIRFVARQEGQAVSGGGS